MRQSWVKDEAIPPPPESLDHYVFVAPFQSENDEAIANLTISPTAHSTRLITKQFNLFCLSTALSLCKSFKTSVLTLAGSHISHRHIKISHFPSFQYLNFSSVIGSKSTSSDVDFQARKEALSNPTCPNYSSTKILASCEKPSLSYGCVAELL